MSNLGELPSFGCSDKVKLVDICGSMSAWFVTATALFQIVCGTHDGKLRLVISSPIGNVTDQEARVLDKVLKRVLQRIIISKHITVGEARR